MNELVPPVYSRLLVNHNKMTGNTESKLVHSLKCRIREASKSFRSARKERHYLKTNDVDYCSFSYKQFSLDEIGAQRNAKIRLEHMGLDGPQFVGRSVLDLGCHVGAMLFQIANYGITKGVGIEFDEEKVEIAREIAKLTEAPLLFQAADLDTLDAEQIGEFDIVLALSIEKHVVSQPRLISLLGKITADLLIFEGNAKCCIGDVCEQLFENGFRRIEWRGYCVDDVREENNRRPILLSWK